MRKVASSLLILVFMAGVTADADPGKKKRDRHASNVRKRSDPSKRGFRGIPWGRSVAFVESREKAEFSMDQHSEGLYVRMYKDELNGFPVNVGYVFADGKLVRGTYVFLQQHASKNRHIVEFAELENLLRGKYGEPTEDDILWSNDTYKDQPKSHGIAILMGHLLVYRSWKTKESIIMLVMDGDGHSIKTTLDYRGKKFEKLERQKRKAKRHDDL